MTCSFKKLVISAAIFVPLTVAAATAGAVPPKNTLVNKPAPAFTRAGLGNERVDLAALRGQVVLLNFWATWCAPCQIEMPRFEQWQQKYHNDGLEIVGISMDDDSELVKGLVRKLRVNYPIVMGDEQLGLAYGGVLGLPVTYLIYRKGVIRARYQGTTNLDGMEKTIRQLLQRH